MVRSVVVVAFWPVDVRRYSTKHACFETADGDLLRVHHMSLENITWCRDDPEALAALKVATALL